MKKFFDGKGRKKSFISMALSIGLIGILSPTAFAQTLELNVVGNVGGEYYAVKGTEDSGYVMVGNRANDAVITKTDANLQPQWTKLFVGESRDEFFHVATADDGGYVAVGKTYSLTGDMAGLGKGGSDAIVVKYDQNGNVQWKKSFGGSKDELYSRVEASTDGGFVVMGQSNSIDKDMQGLGNNGNYVSVLIKYDANGNEKWKRTDSTMSSIRPTSDGGILMVRNPPTSQYNYAMVSKLDANGQTTHQNTFNGSHIDQFSDAVQMPDGGYVAVGMSSSGDGDMYMYTKGSVQNYGGAISYSYSNDTALIIRYNPNGTVKWTSSFGGSGYDRFKSVTVNQAGNIVVVGESTSTDYDMTGINKGNFDAIYVEYNDNGTIKEKGSFGGTNADSFDFVGLNAEGSIYGLGTTQSSDGDMVGVGSGKFLYGFIDPSLPPAPATFQLDKTNPTNQGVNVTINYPSNSTVKEYKVGTNGEWTTYVSPVRMTQNDTIYARSQNALGLYSQESSFIVSNIDMIVPKSPAISVTGNKVSVVSGTDQESGVKETLIKVGTADWVTYTSPITLPYGEYDVLAKTVDVAGNESPIASQHVLIEDPLAVAKSAVAKAENSKAQVDIDSAKELVDALPNSPEKTELLDRLKQLEEQIALEKATNEVIKAEQDKTQEQVDKAKDLVDALPASPEKDDLLDRLKDVQDQIDSEKALENATNEVNKAEQDKTQEQVDKAKDLVEALPNSPEKDELLDRLKDVQDQIDADRAMQEATNEVIKAEQLKTQAQVNKARDLVNALPSSPKQSNLLDRLKVVEDQIALELATQKVVIAEQSKQQSDIDTARTAVNALSDSPNKQALIDRLNAIVPDDSGTTPPEEVIPDKELPGEIGKLTDPADKKTFSDILKAIERAEANPTNRVLVQLAWDKVKAVPDSVKNNMQNKKVYKSLYARAEKLKNDFNAGLEQEALQVAIKKATDYVVSYEKYKLAYYKAKAQESVDALPDGETKTALQARIDAVVMKTA